MRILPTNHPTAVRAAVLLAAFFAFPDCSAQVAKSGGELYRIHCAGCHGHQLQGGTAPALTGGPLRHGADRASIAKVIRHGIPATQMVGWEKTLSAVEIAAVTDYVLAVRADPKTAQIDAKPLRVATKHHALAIERVVTGGMNGPWGIEFVDANRALITGKTGELYWLRGGKLDTTKITGLPKVYGYDLVGGLMDLALDPNYKTNGWVYLTFSHNPQNTTDRAARGMTKVVRGRVNGHRWTDEQTLFEVPDSVRVSGGTRWGSRLLFDRDGYLYFTVGDMQGAKQTGDNPQRFTRAEGKIFRIHPDGSIPKDNPLAGRNDALQAIYAWGTRNVQGLAQHPVTGKIYFTDHGPQGGDEFNVLKKGGNYGWPLVTFGVNYDGSPVSKDTVRAGLEPPLTYWRPSIAACAVEFVTSPLFPKWRNHALVTALKFEELRRLVLDGDRVIEQEVLLKGYGRVRDVKFGPDGALYVLTNAPDELLRITPVQQPGER